MLCLVVVAALLVAVATTTVAADAPAAANIALPGCESRCGSVDIPYPFGTTPSCYRHPGFLVTCNTSKDGGHEPKLFLGSGRGDERQVLHISVHNSTVLISGEVWFFNVGDTTLTPITVVPAGRPYALSAARNRLVHIGCGFNASSWTPPLEAGGDERPFNTCSSACPGDTPQKIRHGKCDGYGCCEASIPTATGGLTSFRAQFRWTTGMRTTCSMPSSGWIVADASVVAVARNWWHGNNRFMLKMSLLAIGHASGLVIPAVLDWVFDDSSTCEEAAQRSDYGCVSKHSECISSAVGSRAHGYFCRCQRGYHGNPYVRDGCERPQNGRRFRAGIIFATGVGIGMCLLTAVLAIIFATKKLKAKKRPRK